MLTSFSSRSVLLAAQVISLGLFVHARTIVHDFNITWVTADPTGISPRPVIGINGRWPIPTIECEVGDRVIVNVRNQLGNQTTSLHFHGFFQRETASMDGAAGVTQCPIPPGSSLQYNLTASQPGTYWYHAHDKGQYPDGLRGPFIVKDPKAPFNGSYDEEYVLTLSDWYHQQMRPLISRFLHVENPTGAEPVPDSALLNETRDLRVRLQPGKTYLFRIINIGAFANTYLWFEGHSMKIVEVDGVYTEQAEASMIYLTPAQRYAVLIKAKDNADANFPFVASMDQDLFDRIPPGLNPNVSGWLVYDEQKALPPPALIDSWNDFDDFGLVPFDAEKLYDKVDQSITLDLAMDNLGDGINYAFFNGVTYLRPKVPSLYTALTTGSNATDPRIYGANTFPHVLKENDTVEIVLNNLDPGKHPFHLHGHNFQTVWRSDADVGVYDATNSTVKMPPVPMKRDTVMVRPNGNLVIRFKADNPGVWLFHCHNEWHMVSGLAMTFIEAPEKLQQVLRIPEDHLQVCRDGGVPTRGNAAGNEQNLLDLSGAIVSPPPLPAGFTPRGIVALVFSILSAFLGIAALTWYGLLDLNPAVTAAASK